MHETPTTTEADLSKLRAKCPDCGCEMWQVRRDQLTLKTAILKLIGGRLFAVCPEGGCRGQVMVPWLKLDPTAKMPRRRRVTMRSAVILDKEPDAGSE